MKTLCIGFIVASSSIFSNEITETLDSIQKSRDLLNQPDSYIYNENSDNEQEIRAAFFEKSDLVKTVLSSLVEKKPITIPSQYPAQIEFDSNRQLIIANTLNIFTDTSVKIVMESFTFARLLKCHYQLTLNGTVQGTMHKGHFLPTSQQQYGTVSTNGLTVKNAITINPNLLVDRSHGGILYDMSTSNRLKDFFTDRIPLAQIFLLSAIEQAKKQNKYVCLTQKEQAIFKGLLPNIKNTIQDNVICYGDSTLTKQYWSAFFKNFVSKHRTLKYQTK